MYDQDHWGSTPKNDVVMSIPNYLRKTLQQLKLYLLVELMSP